MSIAARDFRELRLDGMSRSFGSVNALKSVTLNVRLGEFIALLGPSGCGKSTALNCLAGLLTLSGPDAGAVLAHLPDTIPTLRDIGLPVVVDHMGSTDARAGTNMPGFQSLLRLVGEGGCWVKVSGAHRLSQQAPHYEEARPFHEALVRLNPERLVWGSDWPHPRIEGEMPEAGQLAVRVVPHLDA
jgi:energy-coupling factor transporter ATP-binding protein EcfA2